LRDNVIQIWEGAVFLVLFVSYIAYSIINAKSGEKIKNYSEKNVSVVRSVEFIIVGLGLLICGSHFLVTGAVAIASRWGVSEAIIGITVVAVGTSLPELATSAVAAFKKHNDIAIGNIVGSNIFNILGILGVVGAMGPVEAKGIHLKDILSMTALAVILFAPLLTKRVLTRWQGAVLLGIYAVCIFFIVVQ